MRLLTSVSRNRSSIPHLSAATQIFNAIRRVDHTGILHRTAFKLNNAIVQHIAKKTPFPWSADALEVEPQPLDTVLEALLA
jgi:hypothetical protein